MFQEYRPNIWLNILAKHLVSRIHEVEARKNEHEVGWKSDQDISKVKGKQPYSTLPINKFVYTTALVTYIDSCVKLALSLKTFF